ncbi:MAG: NAD(P)/FAD-dependent oxidoreductase [Nocardioidaceae bacterium]|nr:NAD(P)/FAD-dependent oxidoreductase [Nocardioidaceae bacterium]
MTDLIIAGGGPAGLATALWACRLGLEPLVLDHRAGTIDKACGEGLMPGAVAALARLDIDPEGRPLTGIRYVSGSRSVAAPFRAGPGRGVRRTTLHAAMRQAVDAAGIRVLHEAVTDVHHGTDGIVVNGTCAPWLVAADGLHSPVRRMVGLEMPLARATHRFGLRRHFELAPWTSKVEVHWSRAGEAYVTPVGPGLVGVAVLTDQRGGFDDQLRTFPALADRLTGAVGGEVRGAGPLRQRARRRVAGRVLLVGDAAGYVDALTGEGIALALAQARVAVAAIAAGRPETYERSWRSVTRRYRLLTESLLFATRRPSLRAALVPAAGAVPAVFGGIVNTLARPA